jgi:hypothetical protein
MDSARSPEHGGQAGGSDVAEPEDRPADVREGEASHDDADTGRPEDDSSGDAESGEDVTAGSDAAEHDSTGDERSGDEPDGDNVSDGDDQPVGDDQPDTEDDAADDDEPDRDDTDGDDSTDDDSAESDSAEDGSPEDDSAAEDGDDAVDEGGDTADEEPESAIPPIEPAPFIELMAAYRQPATAGAERLPWSWPTLSPGEREASATVLDAFVESYNRTWAISDKQAVPSCWHRHPALALDLATLAWAYYQAYRDPTATPDLALRFQAHLPRFAERVDRWLGADPGACRAGRHPASWHDTDRVTGARRSTTEDADAVILLGAETFGFVPPPPPTIDE